MKWNNLKSSIYYYLCYYSLPTILMFLYRYISQRCFIYISTQDIKKKVKGFGKKIIIIIIIYVTILKFSFQFFLSYLVQLEKKFDYGQDILKIIIYLMRLFKCYCDYLFKFYLPFLGEIKKSFILILITHIYPKY